MQNDDDIALWSMEYCIDRLFLRLVSVTYDVQKNDGTVQVRKYLEQARKLMKLIPIASPTPAFVIDLLDLTPRLISELATTPPQLQHYILTQSVGRIFEEISFDYHHFSIASRLLVKLV